MSNNNNRNNNRPQKQVKYKEKRVIERRTVVKTKHQGPSMIGGLFRGAIDGAVTVGRIGYSGVKAGADFASKRIETEKSDGRTRAVRENMLTSGPFMRETMKGERSPIHKTQLGFPNNQVIGRMKKAGFMPRKLF
jgi:hypothetical protein